MSTLTFDTLKFANQLKTAGVPATHAEAEAKALSEVFETNLSELATKEDLHREIGDVRGERGNNARIGKSIVNTQGPPLVFDNHAGNDIGDCRAAFRRGDNSVGVLYNVSSCSRWRARSHRR